MRGRLLLCPHKYCIKETQNNCDMNSVYFKCKSNDKNKKDKKVTVINFDTFRMSGKKRKEFYSNKACKLKKLLNKGYTINMCPFHLEENQHPFEINNITGGACDFPIKIPKGVYTSYFPINEKLLKKDLSFLMKFLNKHCKDLSKTKKDTSVKTEEESQKDTSVKTEEESQKKNHKIKKKYENKSTKIFKVFLVIFLIVGIIGGSIFYFYKN